MVVIIEISIKLANMGGSMAKHKSIRLGNMVGSMEIKITIKLGSMGGSMAIEISIKLANIVWQHRNPSDLVIW